MASYDEHIKQARSNIIFLEKTNTSCNDSFWDWQTTVCFYIGVHLINAHLASSANLHYRSHEEVSNAINPYNRLSPCSLPEPVYTAFINLQMLSRRSRYLISEDKSNHATDAHFTSDKFFARAVRNLDKIMLFMNAHYPCNLPVITILCGRLKNDALSLFNVR